MVRLCTQVAEVAMTVTEGPFLWTLSSEFMALSKGLRKSQVEEVAHLAECFPTRNSQVSSSLKLDVVVHICDLSSWETKAGASECKVGLRYITSLRPR